MYPVRPSRTKWSWSLKWGNINSGSIVFPWALTAIAKVTRMALSAEVIALTCFVPLFAKILLGFWTVVTPVSSIFQMDTDSKLYLPTIFPRLSKKALALVGLKLVARARLVAWGNELTIQDSFLELLQNQSGPAISLSVQVGGMFMSCFTSNWYANLRMSLGLSPQKRSEDLMMQSLIIFSSSLLNTSTLR